ncbi:MarR family winged helix-turn-helix transcriptional regulator [Levilactobacillus zymae]|uniref:MarR family winged helix-turn-helix transcriptional regulator n=1 Tax=Levilactobacillus zymae TaxID=267363 RepID=UPI0028B77E98|nr:MarR family winged helix-turn-helix transcriptional regulator [Levilactobacillus zymae]MDT6979809.1 MarR family winged helix-turn-helix transcriptional regulator [Levilactobacillus zymae]
MTQTNELSQSLEWFSQLQKIMRPVTTIKTDEITISLEQFNLLHAITDQRDDFTPTKFANQIGVSKSMISGQISRLLRAGLIESIASKVDRRQHNLKLTPEGVKVYTQVRGQVVDRLNQLHADISKMM